MAKTATVIGRNGHDRSRNERSSGERTLARRDRKQVHPQIPEWAYDRAEAEAEVNGQSVNAVICGWIVAHLRNIHPEAVPAIASVTPA